VADVRIVTGDLLDQPVEAIVNPWNRNIIPWWLLLPHGVSGAIKRRGGYAPFRELARIGPLPLGRAAITTAGRLPFRGIIHVAALDLTWRSSERAIRLGTQNALAAASAAGFASVAFPLIGAGVGGVSPATAELAIVETAQASDYAGVVMVVRFG